jgi:hypothetical protein
VNHSMRRLTELSPGDRFAALPGGRRAVAGRDAGVDPVILVLDRFEENRAHARAADGSVHEYVTTYIDPPPVRDSSPRIVWTDPLPEGTDAQASAWVGAMGGSGRRPVALHVVEVHDTVFDAVYVARAGDGAQIDTGDFEKEFRRTGDGGLALSLRRLSVEIPDGLHPVVGDLVVAASCSCRAEGDRTTVRLDGPRIVGNFDEAGLDAFVPRRPVAPAGRLHSSASMVPDYDAFVDEEWRAILCAQPDRALVLNLPGDPDVGSVLLASTGFVFGGDNQAMDYFDGEHEPHGLLVLDPVSMRGTYDSHTGEHDVDFDYVAVPARSDDLASFGISVQDLPKLLLEGYEYACDDVAKLLAPAVAAAPAP